MRYITEGSVIWFLVILLSGQLESLSCSLMQLHLHWSEHDQHFGIISGLEFS